MSKPKPLEPLVQVHLMLPPELVRRIDEAVRAGVAANRTELIRRAVREYAEAELKREPKP
jgi:Arc/MetJ-type ribon-helix-helix transcriptional regulator